MQYIKHKTSNINNIHRSSKLMTITASCDNEFHRLMTSELGSALNLLPNSFLERPLVIVSRERKNNFSPGIILWHLR